jgi:endonuclease/exonuclease/phosphatase family metal-dependent hydrolase
LPGPRKFAIGREEPRAAVVGRLQTPCGLLTVVNTHLSFVPGWNRVQLRALRRDVAAFDGPHVLMGDLNMTPPAPQRLTGYQPLAVAPTFPQDRPTRQLDHILVHGRFPRVLHCEAVEAELSDHRALVVELEEGCGDATP